MALVFWVRMLFYSRDLSSISTAIDTIWSIRVRRGLYSENTTYFGTAKYVDEPFKTQIMVLKPLKVEALINLPLSDIYSIDLSHQPTAIPIFIDISLIDRPPVTDESLFRISLLHILA